MSTRRDADHFWLPTRDVTRKIPLGATTLPSFDANRQRVSCFCMEQTSSSSSGQALLVEGCKQTRGPLVHAFAESGLKSASEREGVVPAEWASPPPPEACESPSFCATASCWESRRRCCPHSTSSSCTLECGCASNQGYCGCSSALSLPLCSPSVHAAPASLDGPPRPPWMDCSPRASRSRAEVPRRVAGSETRKSKCLPAEVRGTWAAPPVCSAPRRTIRTH